MTRLYTGKGDDGTTGLLFGGRVPKDSAHPRAVGAVDEAQAVIGVARSLCEPGGELDHQLTQVCRDLWVLMGELATLPENHDKLTDDQTRVSAAMVDADRRHGRRPRRPVRGARRLRGARPDPAGRPARRGPHGRPPGRARGRGGATAEGSHVLAYLNRLSSLLWVQARWVEGEHLLSRDVAVDDPAGDGG